MEVSDSDYVRQTDDGIFQDNPRMDSHRRSLIKGVTYRIFSTTTTFVIAFVITGHFDVALQIGVAEFIAKLLIYYLHERLWTKIRL